MTSHITNITKTCRAAFEFSTKLRLRAAVPFVGAFRFSASPTPPEMTRHAPDAPRAGEHSAPVVAIPRARPRDFLGVRPTRFFVVNYNAEDERECRSALYICRRDPLLYRSFRFCNVRSKSVLV